MAKSKSKRVGDFSIRADSRRGTDEAGRQYHRIVRYEGGKEVTAWSGWATPQEAQKHAASMIIEPQAMAPKEVEIQTIRDLCECFLGSHQDQVSESSRTAMRLRLKAIVKGLGDLRIDRFGVRDLDAYARQRKTEASPATIALEVRILGQAWHWARQRELIPNRDMPKITLKVTPTRERFTPTDDEIQRVLAVFRARGGWRYLAVLLLAETGARLGEIADLKRKNIDRERLVLRVDGKTGAREIPITPQVLAEIRPFLLGSPEGGLFGVSGHTVRQLGAPTGKREHAMNLQKGCEVAGVQRFTPHGLRRAFVDRCYRAGIDPVLESSLAGHSVTVAMALYRQVREGEKRGAVSQISMLTRAQ